MNGQLKLSAEQVVVAIEMLSPAEKRKVQRRLPNLFGIPDYASIPNVGAEQSPVGQESQQAHPYAFYEVRKLLSSIQGTVSTDVIADREDRF